MPNGDLHKEVYKRQSFSLGNNQSVRESVDDSYDADIGNKLEIEFLPDSTLAGNEACFYAADNTTVVSRSTTFHEMPSASPFSSQAILPSAESMNAHASEKLRLV
eukprot:gb/GEZN01024838.1/.p2 GENE.gb/GEZN01024838.1/~~gb/GEZN01024838.1/.p2  ORF type:complete len:105 (-),score=13.74 gb/GEZN01024838.1/:22-336(-)